MFMIKVNRKTLPKKYDTLDNARTAIDAIAELFFSNNLELQAQFKTSCKIVEKPND